METALVFLKDGAALHWHEPPGRSGGSLPDSRSLWDVLWANRHNIGGVAHTHPWHGEAWPSGTDLTTFAAIEAGLGTKLLWPIVTFSEVRYFLAKVIWRVDEEKSPVYVEANMTLSEMKAFHERELWLENVARLRDKSR